MNQKLLAAIKAEQAKDQAGISDRSSVLGWHSHDRLTQHPDFKELIGITSKNVLEIAQFSKWDLTRLMLVITNCWALVNPTYASNVVHDHPNCVLSGVYYVQAPADCGDLFFIDPRDAVRMNALPVTEYNQWTQGKVVYKPIEGRMVIFPSFLLHGVGANMSDQERISISFNVRVAAKQA
jgi:uncharacterized protein (TIGR02466 family)